MMAAATVHTPARDGVEAGSDRSRDIEVFCSRLGRVLSGRAAEALLDAGVEDADAFLVVLPSWSWAVPAIPLGRKSVARDGGTLRMPVRLSWDTGPVVLGHAGTGDVTATWSASGLGRSGSATTVVSCRDAAGSLDALDLPGFDGPVPSRVHAGLAGSDHVRAELRMLAEDGRTALWEVVADLEPVVRREVGSATGRVFADVIGPDPSGRGVVAIDPVAVESIATTMMYGSDSSSKPSKVMSMLERALRPGEFARVDPSRWLRITIRRDAEQEVRRVIGDPHVGRKVRNLAREIGHEALADLDEFVRAYGERYPADRVARSRVLDALGADLGPLARAVPDDRPDEVHHSPWDCLDPVFVAAMERIAASTGSRR